MCGIFGHSINKRFNLCKSVESLNTLMHRGPDQQNYYLDNQIFLGHRRLSILDLTENGKQPMESEQAVITVNGEIYNYQKLRTELEKKYTFQSNSDSEVILHGYTEWGITELLSRIDGMYAIAIYDKRKKLIYLARDRYGIKPLYYSLIEDQLTWASELKALKHNFNEQDLSIDYTAVYDYLTYLYIPTPKTLYKQIYKLAPAHFLCFDISSLNSSTNKYWKLETKEIAISLKDACFKIKELIDDSVKEQLISDVPVGFFLSGGIDSSIVVSTASKYTNTINTYTIGFDVEEHSETKYAKIISQLFNTNHQEGILKSSEANKLINNIPNWYDEPFADTSAIPSYLVSDFAKKTSTVVLTGDGGDELFGGYDWYERFNTYKKNRFKSLRIINIFASKIRSKYNYSIVGRIANQIEYRTCNDLELYTKLLGGMLKHEKKEYRKKWNIPDEYDDYWYFSKFMKNELSSRKKLQYLDFHTYLHDDIFTKVDRVSMAVSLECRVPFMKKELVEFAFSLPESIIYNNEELKGILKAAYFSILPEEILQRKKRGFNIPLKNWTKTILANKKTQQERILDLFKIE